MRKPRRLTPRPATVSRMPSPEMAVIPRVEALVGRELAGLVQTSRFNLGNGEDPHPSEILKRRSKPGQRLGELWGYMLEKDAFLAGLWGKRWRAVLGLPRYILPLDESPRAKEIAHFCRHALAEVPNLHINLRHQLEALTHGWSAEEILWERRDRGPIAGRWGIDLIDRPMWRFLYKSGELYIRRNDGEHLKAPAGKFLVNRTGSKDSPWGGLGLLHHVYWYWFSGEHGWKYFAILLEKWAQPTAVGKYRRSLDSKIDQSNVNRLFQAIDRIQTEYSIVIPDDLVVELLEAKRGGDVTYETFIGLANLAKALVILGEGDTSGFEKGQGSFARRRVSNEVRLETIRIDARELDAHLTDNLLRLLVQVNFGEDAPVPRWFTEVEDAEDLRMRQERADALLDRGLPLTLEDLYRINRQRMPRSGESIVRLASPDKRLELIDPPEGFDIATPEEPDIPIEPEPSEPEPPEAPPRPEARFVSTTERVALRRYRAGDIHQFALEGA